MLQAQHTERYEDGQLRTLQRRVRWWRAAHGPEQEIMLAQQHRVGEAAQTDFTGTTELAVTLAGQVFVHLLCVLVQPYSHWQWVTVCLSESMAALRKGVQRALLQLGRVPRYHQTDNSTAATHRIPADKKACFMRIDEPDVGVGVLMLQVVRQAGQLDRRRREAAVALRDPEARGRRACRSTHAPRGSRRPRSAATPRRATRGWPCRDLRSLRLASY
jgi:hypothetical protein